MANSVDPLSQDIDLMVANAELFIDEDHTVFLSFEEINFERVGFGGHRDRTAIKVKSLYLYIE